MSGSVVPPAVSLTDPHEVLEVYTPEGAPTGQGAARGEVHLRGLWHCAFYCWVARPGADGPDILLQHRAERKDVFPGMFDASAAGHKRLGEPMSDAVRELQEELGLTEQLDELLAFGAHSQEHVHETGLIDREHHALHLLARRIDDGELHPDPLEVQGVAWVPGSVLVDLAHGARERATVPYLAVGADRTLTTRQRELRATELVPYDGDYHRRIVELAAAALREKGLL